MANPFTNTEQVNAVIKVRRGPEIDRQQFQYEDGELIYSTDKKRLFVGDGTDTNGTLGGILVGNKTWYVDSFDKLPYIQKYDTVYRTDLKGEYVYYGNNYLLSSNYVLVGGRKLITDNVNISDYQLPNATTTIKGGIVVGSGLKANNGTLAIDFDPNAFTLNGNKITLLSLLPPPSNDATYLTKGIVKVNDGSNGQGGIKVTNGSIYVSIDNTTLKLNSGTNILRVDPLAATIPATTSLIGGLILGAGLSSRTDTGLTNVNVDNNTIKISPVNALYVDTTVVGSGPSGPGSSFTLNDGTSDLTGVTKLTVDQANGLNLSPTGGLSLNIGSNTVLGGVKPLSGLTIDGTTGEMNVDVDNTSIYIDSSQKLGLVDTYVTDIIDGYWDGSSKNSTNGCQVFGSQIFMQWGQATITASTNTTVTFISAFASTPYCVVATHKTTGTPVAIGTDTFTTTNFKAYVAANSTLTFNWIAFGAYS